MILGVIVVVVVGVLVINYFKGLDTGSTLPIGGQAEVLGPTITRDGKTFHVVQPNDNLWKVAERYYDSGYNWVDIAQANELVNPGVIEKGQELEIPDVEPKLNPVLTECFILNIPIEKKCLSSYSFMCAPEERSDAGEDCRHENSLQNSFGDFFCEPAAEYRSRPCPKKHRKEHGEVYVPADEIDCAPEDGRNDGYQYACSDRNGRSQPEENHQDGNYQHSAAY